MRGRMSVLLLLLAPCVTMAAPQADFPLSFETAVPDPSNPHNCMLPNGISLPAGEANNNAEGCKTLICSVRVWTLFLTTGSCGVVKPRPACRVESQPWRSYPECCPKEVCPWCSCVFRLPEPCRARHFLQWTVEPLWICCDLMVLGYYMFYDCTNRTHILVSNLFRSLSISFQLKVSNGFRLDYVFDYSENEKNQR